MSPHDLNEAGVADCGPVPEIEAMEVISPDWHEADIAYRLHHFNCVHCIAAGKNPALRPCPTGAALWATYESAGMPPHIFKPRTEHGN